MLHCNCIVVTVQLTHKFTLTSITDASLVERKHPCEVEGRRPIPHVRACTPFFPIPVARILKQNDPKAKKSVRREIQRHRQLLAILFTYV